MNFLIISITSLILLGVFFFIDSYFSSKKKGKNLEIQTDFSLEKTPKKENI